jgi:DNA-binding beta-propeller fold protein YncE
VEPWNLPEPDIVDATLNHHFGQGLRWGDNPDVLPEGWSLGQVSGVASHPDGEVYVYQRGAHADPLLVYDRSGTYLRSFGRGRTAMPHSVRLGPDGNLWLVDSLRQTVDLYRRDGTHVRTIGVVGDAGTDDRRFNEPTDVAFGSNGVAYISDGYGNSRVVMVDLDGRYLGAWGRPGTATGEFNTPHSIAVSRDGLVHVADRENARIQIFEPDGRHHATWTHLGLTQGITITPDDVCWVVTARLRGGVPGAHILGWRLVRLELASGRPTGVIEGTGHMIDVAAWGDLFVAGLEGTMFQWTLSS